MNYTSTKKRTYDTDAALTTYQSGEQASSLLEQYEQFIEKYVLLLHKGIFDNTNYDIRYFLTLYIKDPDTRKALRRGKYHSGETLREAQRTIAYIRRAFEGMTEEDIRHEIYVPFLLCGQRYKKQHTYFGSYLNKSFRYRLKEHIDPLLRETLRLYGEKPEGIGNIDGSMKEEEIDVWFDNLEWNDPKWLSGEKATGIWKELTRKERFVLSKYYGENYKDKEIARMIGIHRESITRIRKRITKKWKESYTRKEAKT